MSSRFIQTMFPADPYSDGRPALEPIKAFIRDMKDI